METREYRSSIRDKNVLKWVGCKMQSTQHGPFIVTDYTNNKNVSIEFENTGTNATVSLQSVQEGCVADYMQPSLCGVAALGFPRINYDKRTTKKAYRSYVAMIERVYRDRENSFAYEGCSVAQDWLFFENYKPFFVEDPYRQEGWHLDKDLLLQGNKIYSKETCVFLPPEINQCLVGSPKNLVKELPTGVSYDKGCNKYIASFSNSYADPPQRYMKRYDTKEQAFAAYKEYKEGVFRFMADKWEGLISEKAYQALINRRVYE